MKKSNLGQFYTTNADFIIGNLKSFIPETDEIIDPFAGNWDLLNLFPNIKKRGIDIDPKNKYTEKGDSFFNSVDYTNKWVITNPPYLARNKNENKSIYEYYDVDDLYKAALLSIIGCKGGIIILPVNFFSSEDSSIRDKFLSKYKIEKVNVFEDQVFSDTTYTVCSFFFIREDNTKQEIEFQFFPTGKSKKISIKKDQGYQIGHEVKNLNKSSVKIGRLLEGEVPNSNILLRAVDTGSTDGRIGLQFSNEPYFGKKTDRTFAMLKFDVNLSREEQEIIIQEFNRRIEDYRDRYNSLLFSNYRNSGRKRISFSFAYLLVSNIIREELGYTEQPQKTDSLIETIFG